MKFRKRVKLFPGVTLNFSRSGISTTVGVPGASLNFNRNGTFLNTGIPGTGLYDRKRLGGPNKSNPSLRGSPGSSQPQKPMIPDQTTAWKSTDNVEETTTPGLQELQDMLLACYQEKHELEVEIIKAKSSLKTSHLLRVFSYLFIIGFFIKWFSRNRDAKQAYLEDLEKQLASCYVDIAIRTDKQIEEKFRELLDSYKTLLTCEKIWDITATTKIDKVAVRSSASESVSRKAVTFGFANVDIIKSTYDALHFENANGGDLYIYPAFVAIIDSNKKFGLIAIEEVQFTFSTKQFLEESSVPTDAKVIGTTWAKVNKNGSPDRRFRDNYEIPICLYGTMLLKSTTGLNEAYWLSDYTKAEQFATSFKAYQTAVGP